MTDEWIIEQLEQILHLDDPTREQMLQFIELTQQITADQSNAERIFMMFSDNVAWFDPFKYLDARLADLQPDVYVFAMLRCLPAMYSRAKNWLRTLVYVVFVLDGHWQIFPNAFVRAKEQTQHKIMVLVKDILDDLSNWGSAENDLADLIEERINYIKRVYATHQQPRLL